MSLKTMSLKTVFTISALIAGVFGVGFLFAPNASERRCGVDASQAESPEPMGRYLGAYISSFAILFWFMRNAPKSETTTTVCRAISLSFLTGVLASATEQKRGTVASRGWAITALYGVLSAVYAYFGFGEGAQKSESAQKIARARI